MRGLAHLGVAGKTGVTERAFIIAVMHMKDEYIDNYGIDSLPQLKEASEMKAKFFVTTNESLLEDREELEKEFNISIRTPEEFVKNEANN